jgi:hypothetical protein
MTTPDTPKPLLSLHRLRQLTGYSLGHRLHLCVSKHSSGRRLHEAETGSHLTNGSCAMSLNFRLPPKLNRDFCSLASHEPGFESHREYLGHVRPSYAGSGASCAKHSSNPGSWLAKEQKSRFSFGGRRLLLLNDEAWRCHPYTQAL